MRGGSFMARPKGRQEPRQTMTIRISAEEQQVIEQKAKEQKMKPSAYVRAMALNGGVIDPYVHIERQKLRREISAIGNNINQIARMANTNKYIMSHEIKEVQKLLRDIYQLINKE